MTRNPPAGYGTVTPQSIVPEPREAIDFMREVFGATLDDQYLVDDVIVHAEVIVGNSRIMVGAANDEYPPLPMSAQIYVDDVDATYAKAVEQGASSKREPEDQFYGDRTAVVTDQQGNQWSIATAIEEVSREEMHRRMAEMSG